MAVTPQFLKAIQSLQTQMSEETADNRTLVGLVTDNDDPLGLRRVKVALPEKGGQIETDWLVSGTGSPYINLPLPQIGQMVNVNFLEGNNHQGMWQSIINNATAEPPTDINSLLSLVPGISDILPGIGNVLNRIDLEDVISLDNIGTILDFIGIYGLGQLEEILGVVDLTSIEDPQELLYLLNNLGISDLGKLTDLGELSGTAEDLLNLIGISNVTQYLEEKGNKSTTENTVVDLPSDTYVKIRGKLTLNVNDRLVIEVSEDGKLTISTMNLADPNFVSSIIDLTGSSLSFNLGDITSLASNVALGGFDISGALNSIF